MRGIRFDVKCLSGNPPDITADDNTSRASESNVAPHSKSEILR